MTNQILLQALILMNIIPDDLDLLLPQVDVTELIFRENLDLNFPEISFL